jgi:hypothetical protein
MRISSSTIKRRLAHLEVLDALGPTEVWLAGVPSGKIAHFAGEARVTDVADLRKINDEKRLTLLISLIHECRTAARDEVVTMFCKRMAALYKKGRERLAELPEAHRVESGVDLRPPAVITPAQRQGWRVQRPEIPGWVAARGLGAGMRR